MEEWNRGLQVGPIMVSNKVYIKGDLGQFSLKEETGRLKNRIVLLGWKHW